MVSSKHAARRRKRRRERTAKKFKWAPGLKCLNPIHMTKTEGKPQLISEEMFKVKHCATCRYLYQGDVIDG